MKKFKVNNLFFAILLVAGLYSCTDLEIEETDSFITEGFQGLESPSSALTGLYSAMGNNWSSQEQWYALNTVTTDEQLIPTRGGDWDDNGLWRKLHQHSWAVEDRDVVNSFNLFNANQLAASQILDERSAATSDVAAQAHFLRAFNMYIILDFFGQVPYRDTQLSSSSIPEVLWGADAVNFILADLDAAIPGLKSIPAGGGQQDEVGKAAARYLKAKVLLNRHVFENQYGPEGPGTEGTPGSPSAADMQEVVSLVDQIAADGYALQGGYFDIFRDTPDSESIWFLTATNTGAKIFNSLHYNSPIGGGGWNGFSTLAEFYDLFEGDSDANEYVGDVYSGPANNQEERRGGVPVEGAEFADRAGTSEDANGFEDGSAVGQGFLIGQQYGTNNEELEDRQGAPLFFTREFRDNSGNLNLQNNNEVTGIRVLKYHPRYSGGFQNHQIVFRYADAHLMKAEAILRGASGDAGALVNELRALRGADVLASVSEQDLLDERGRELYLEGWRRNDLIRFGQYTRDWEFKSEAAINNPARRLFPIPLPQILANPNLAQNPGY